MTELTLLLPVPGMRLEVRILVALPGILTARLVLGRRGLLQGMSFASLERVVVRLDLRVWRMLTAPLPSRGFAWREVAWAAFQSPMASSRRSGGSPVLLVSRFWAGFFHPLLSGLLGSCFWSFLPRSSSGCGCFSWPPVRFILRLPGLLGDCGFADVDGGFGSWGAEWMFAFGRSSSSVSTLLPASLMGG